MNFNQLSPNIDFYKKYMKYNNKYKNLFQNGGNSNSKKIDLTNIIPNNLELVEKKNGIEVYANYDDFKKKKFSPMFLNPLNARKISPTNSVHLVIPGLLPAYNKKWIDYPEDQIFYMPNDLKPHFHGEAQHHMQLSKGIKINEVFSLKINKFVKVTNNKLESYRKYLKKFNQGYEKTPIETWIHWMIPYNQEEYPKLIVKKNSIIWWDFNKHHNLNLVSKDNYNNNISNSDTDVLFPMDDSNLQVKVTIMDKVGIFYFLCSVSGHAKLGHKIIIEVIN